MRETLKLPMPRSLSENTPRKSSTIRAPIAPLAMMGAGTYTTDEMNVRHFEMFSELVRAIRRKHCLSQRALAKALEVSPGYIGQWELRLSQPSPEVAVKLCQAFGIDDTEYVQRLAYAGRAPEWLRESIVRYCKEGAERSLPNGEQRLLQAFRRLDISQQSKMVEKVEGWVEATLDISAED